MLPFTSFTVSPLNAHYAEHYTDREYEWIRINAKRKANNIAYMIGKSCDNVNSVLEVGCGAGLVLQCLSSLGVGQTYDGVDIEDPSAHTIQNKLPNIVLPKYDGQKLPFEDKSFDLVYSTHVLEHVSDERGFISELIRVARKSIYIEVPCELHIRSNHRAIQRTLDIGHINFYNLDSFLATLETSGLKIKNVDIFDHDLNVYRAMRTAWKAYLSAFVRKTLLKINKRMAAKFFCYHCGALCVPNEK